jgi:hypothetical protein
MIVGCVVETDERLACVTHMQCPMHARRERLGSHDRGSTFMTNANYAVIYPETRWMSKDFKSSNAEVPMRDSVAITPSRQGCFERWRNL